MLIDKIIIAKTDYTPDQFTGGAVQYSVSKHTKKLTVTLVLYFGFNDKNTSIYEKIEIQEKDINTINKELLLKAKTYRESLIDSKLILSLDDLVNVSHESSTKENESSTTIAKNLSISNDKKIIDNIDIDKGKLNASLRSASISLSIKKDINNHKPYQTIKEVDEFLIDEDVTDEDIDIIVRFIEYRDEMYNRTKDKKYGLKSYRAIQLFMIEIYKSNDIYKAFETMELNEWTTYKKEWDKNK